MASESHLLSHLSVIKYWKNLGRTHWPRQQDGTHSTIWNRNLSSLSNKTRNIQHLVWSSFLAGHLLSDPPTHPRWVLGVGLLKGQGWGDFGRCPSTCPSVPHSSFQGVSRIQTAFISFIGLPILSLTLYFGLPLPLRYAKTEDVVFSASLFLLTLQINI